MADDAASDPAEAGGAAASPAGGDTLHQDYDPDSPFQCCVCLDLLYKPIVLSCGHISCFWCVHRGMHVLQASQCPICRQPYRHFPSICILLHYLLLKLEPVAYNRREKEVLEEERRLNTYSPQLLEDIVSDKVNSDCQASSTVVLDHLNSVEKGLECGTSHQVPLHDFLCTLCKEILYEPSVLNCGHVYCATCLSTSVEPLKCQACQSMHPGKVPNVCLDLDRFLQKQFPKEYESRREHLLMGKIKNLHRATTSGTTSSSTCRLKDHQLWTEESLSNLHIGVGCDSCGMFPIIGKRYKCKDCEEEIGYDLCEACYNSTSKLPGRFNQRHTPDHKFELDESSILGKWRTILINDFPDNLPEEDSFHHDDPQVYFPLDCPEDQENLDDVSGRNGDENEM